MKPPRIKIAIKMPDPPASKALKAGQAVLSAFAHHPPSEAPEVNTRMSRPGHPHGPHN